MPSADVNDRLLRLLDVDNDKYVGLKDFESHFGVEKSNKQSFIACIADVYTFHHDVDVPSIKKMRKIISDSISLDLYLKVFNDLVLSTL